MIYTAVKGTDKQRRKKDMRKGERKEKTKKIRYYVCKGVHTHTNIFASCCGLYKQL
jgi:hypothetical protein